LIDRLMLCGARSAARLTAFERDRILAGVYWRLYGDRIESTLVCSVCSRPFELVFSLRDMVARSTPVMTPAGDGTYSTSEGLHFRLPTGEDELSVLDLPAEEAVRELLRRCVLAPATFDAAAVQDAMEKAAPILDVDINTSCAECGAPVSVRFDLQSYLLQSIIQDRRRLWRETHVLAAAYRWSLDEIMSLTRADRGSLVAMIEADAARRMVV